MNEELCIAYVAPDPLLEERKRMLHDSWGITCQCELCIISRNSPKLNTLVAEINGIFEQCYKLRSQNVQCPLGKVLPATKKAELIEFIGSLPLCCRFPLSRLYELETGDAISSGRIDEAIEYLGKMIPIVEICHGGDVNEQQRVLLQRATCLLQLGRLEEARQDLTQARNLCGVWLTQPSGHTFVAFCCANSVQEDRALMVLLGNEAHIADLRYCTFGTAGVR